MSTVKVAAELMKQDDKHIVGGVEFIVVKHSKDDKNRLWLESVSDSGERSYIEYYKGQIKVDKIISK